MVWGSTGYWIAFAIAPDCGARVSRAHRVQPSAIPHAGPKGPAYPYPVGMAMVMGYPRLSA